MQVIQVKIDASEVSHELDRLSGHPTHSLIALEAALEATFEATQLDVHVITGSLRNSGKSESGYHNDQWEGTIQYGGRAPGSPHAQVDYAFYEWRRGGTHDFLRAVPGFRETFADAVEAHFNPNAV